MHETLYPVAEKVQNLHLTDITEVPDSSCTIHALSCSSIGKIEARSVRSPCTKWKKHSNKHIMIDLGTG